MKNIIPFKKEVIFKTNLSEITSISLENTLGFDKDTVSGEFIISGDYKISDKSTTVEPFEIKLPFEIVMDDRYDTAKAIVDIDDFYYEIVNNNVLSISIDVLVDKLQEKPIVELEDLVDVTPQREILDSEEEDMKKENIFDVKEEVRDAIVEEQEEIKEDKREVKEIQKEEEKVVERKTEQEEVEDKINSLFNQFNSDSDVYVTYNVFILREGDSLESVMEKYNITEEELREYNDLSNLQLGDKLIIPNSYERD